MADNNSDWTATMVQGLKAAQEKQVWDKDRFPDPGSLAEQPSEIIGIGRAQGMVVPVEKLREIAVRLRKLVDVMHNTQPLIAEVELDGITTQLEELLLKE